MMVVFIPQTQKGVAEIVNLKSTKNWKGEK